MRTDEKFMNHVQLKIFDRKRKYDNFSDSIRQNRLFLQKDIKAVQGTVRA